AGDRSRLTKGADGGRRGGCECRCCDHEGEPEPNREVRGVRVHFASPPFRGRGAEHGRGRRPHRPNTALTPAFPARKAREGPCVVSRSWVYGPSLPQHGALPPPATGAEWPSAPMAVGVAAASAAATSTRASRSRTERFEDFVPIWCHLPSV